MFDNCYSFIGFLRDNGYYAQYLGDAIAVEPIHHRQIICYLYFTEGKIVCFCWEYLMNAEYKHFLSLFTTEPLFKYPAESGSMKVFTLITGIKDE